MNDQTDAQLLRAYAEHRSEPAFAELVRRHLDIVHSAALRMVCDSHLAQDVTQSVFLALASNAAQLTDRPVLSGWLHRTAQNIAAQTVRTDVRRRVREQEAAAMNQLLAAEPDALWEHIAPQLDTALSELSEADRDALLLRYFERKSASEMATTLGISDEAAQKRVSRAVERLREFFLKRGLTVGASGLAVVISANAVQAAPVGLAVTISTAAALAGTSIATTTMNWLNLKSITAIVAAALAAGTGTHIVEQREADRLRDEEQHLIFQQEKLIGERDSALSTATGYKDELERLQNDKIELLRLRSEVGKLRNHAKELESLQADYLKIRATLADRNQNRQEPEFDPAREQEKALGILRLKNARDFVVGMHLYAQNNTNQFPVNFEQVAPFLVSPGDPLVTNLNKFEIVYQGSLTNMANPSSIIVIREKEALFRSGVWVKAYGFADAHPELKIEPEGGFDVWEKQHMISTLPSGQ